MAQRDELDYEDEGSDGDDEFDDGRIDDTYLTFYLEGIEYALAVEHVREIVRMPEFMEVPDVPEFIRGIINLRGRVIPLMDGRARLGLQETEYNDRTVAIVLESGGSSTGFVADGVSGVATIQPDCIDPAPSSHGRTRLAGAVAGIGRIDDTIAIVLDAEKLLGDGSTLASQ